LVNRAAKPTGRQSVGMRAMADTPGGFSDDPVSRCNSIKAAHRHAANMVAQKFPAGGQANGRGTRRREKPGLPQCTIAGRIGRSIRQGPDRHLKRDDDSSNRHPALAYWWSMIFSENRCPLFGIML
jgi:hypothetical protein